MQCPSCEFNCIPGSRACARCGTRLDLEGVDVLPPRASDHAIPLPLRRATWRIRISLANEVYDIAHGLSRRLGIYTEPAIIARVIIPGWGHRAANKRSLGWAMTAIWLVLVVVAIYLRGGPGGWPAYFMLVGWHGFTLSLLMTPILRNASFAERLLVGVAIWVLLNALVYVPAGWLMSRLVVPVPTHALPDGRGIRTGEIVLRQGPWLRPPHYQRGDVVAYSTRGARAAGVVILEGILIDRIIAVPGDSVRITPNAIFVNGEQVDRADQLPLAHVRFVEDQFIVSQDQYLILPSMTRYMIYGGHTTSAPVAAIHALKHVPHENVLGKVIFRTRPLMRAGPMDWNEPTAAEEAALRTNAQAGSTPAAPDTQEAAPGGANP